MKPSRGEVILDRLRAEAALEDEGHPIRKRSFLLAVEEIERLRAVLQRISKQWPEDFPGRAAAQALRG